jgi:hypothetical protein
MSTYQVTSVGGMMTFEKPLKEILAELKPGGGIKILDPVEFVTDRQRRWYKGVCLPWLVKHEVINKNQESTAWWDMEVKKRCDGLNLLKLEYKEWFDGTVTSRLTTKDVGKKKMTAFIEEILAMSVEKNWGLAPPDKDLRK